MNDFSSFDYETRKLHTLINNKNLPTFPHQIIFKQNVQKHEKTEKLNPIFLISNKLCFVINMFFFFFTF